MPKETVFIIPVEGIPVQVHYRPEYFSILGYDHMAFTSTSEPRRGIPISHTGYRSHFLHRDALPLLGTPEAYARAYCKAFLRQGREPSLQEILNADAAQAAQASLFG
jgi:hypothetical protein